MERMGYKVSRPTDFQIKDSGERAQFNSGMVRDTSAGKVRYNRVLEGPMFQRWAEHLAKGAIKYPDVAPGVANWTLADSEEELQRFKESAFSHFIQWLRGDVDEDHAAGVFFNINGAEYTKARAGMRIALKLPIPGKVVPYESSKPITIDDAANSLWNK